MQELVLLQTFLGISMALGVVLAGALLRRCFVIRQFVINTKIVTQVSKGFPALVYLLQKSISIACLLYLLLILPPSALHLHCCAGHTLSLLRHGLQGPVHTQLALRHRSRWFSVLTEDTGAGED